MRDTPAPIKTPSGYVQQSTRLSIASKSLEMRCKYMAEIGMPPSSRSRVTVIDGRSPRPWEAYNHDPDDAFAI